jgi:hypothetical protein
MNKLMNFFKSTNGKILLIVLALLVVGYIVYKQYEKKIYGGLTKSKYIDSIAQLLFDSKLTSIKNENGYVEANLSSILNYYYIGYTDGTINNSTSIARVSDAVDNSNIDFTKVKDLAALKQSVLEAYFNKFK